MSDGLPILHFLSYFHRRPAHVLVITPRAFFLKSLVFHVQVHVGITISFIIKLPFLFAILSFCEIHSGLGAPFQSLMGGVYY